MKRKKRTINFIKKFKEIDEAEKKKTTFNN